jgi:ribosomal protein S12 methylthiotransferase accessory factor
MSAGVPAWSSSMARKSPSAPEHRVIGAPTSVGAAPLNGRDRARLERLLGLWGYIVDRKVGIVSAVWELIPDDDDPDFFHYLSRACDTSRFTALRNFGNNGGVSTSRYVALAKAVGEAVERYCGAMFDYRDLIYASYAELDRPATDPAAFALYAPEQFGGDDFPWKPFTADAPIAWTPGRSLLTDDEILVPAAMVYVPYHYLGSRPDTPIVQPISTGLACGCSFADAALSGLTEAIERDAFTLTWQARMSRPHIETDGLPARVRDLLRRYADVGLRVELMDITTDIVVPTVLTIALGDASTSPAVTVAAASDPSPERALVKSLEELAHTRKFAKQVMEFLPEIPSEPDHPSVREQTHHLRFYCPQYAKTFAEFAWASPERRSFGAMADCSQGSTERELSAVTRELAQRGLEPIACDLTTPDIGALGLSVVRVVVPGLNPLFMGFGNRALGGARLHSVPAKLGHPGLDAGAPDNPYPHPFP